MKHGYSLDDHVGGWAQLAKSMGCRSVALHYDIKDDGILRMYKSAGYQEVLYEPAWAPFVMGRPSVRLCLMLKILP